MAPKAETTQPNRISAIILFAVIAGAPFPFGSTSHIAIAFWCGMLSLGVLTASPSSLQKGHLVLLAGMGFVVAAYAFVLHEQMSNTPWIANPNPIWAQTSKALGIPIKPSVSIVRYEPFYALGAPLSSILALILGLVVGADDHRARQALLVIGWSGVAYAVYGIAALLFEPTTILWREKTFNTESVTATFINRNTAAAYFGSCAVAWLVMLMARIRGNLPSGPITWKRFGQSIGSEHSSQKGMIIRFCAFFVCLTAMFMTGSRGGVIVSLFAMVVGFAVFFHRDLSRIISLVLAVIAAGVMALALLHFLGGNVESRFDAGGLVEQGRSAAYQSTLRLIADYPWFGTGLGTFAEAFPAYRSANISIFGVWDIAHSTPLEMAAELGIPLTLIVAAGWLVIFSVLVRGTRRSRRETVAPLVALGIALIAVLHSSIDFSLQIPGFAIVVFAIVGVGLGQSFAGAARQKAG